MVTRISWFFHEHPLPTRVSTHVKHRVPVANQPAALLVSTSHVRCLETLISARSIELQEVQFNRLNQSVADAVSMKLRVGTDDVFLGPICAMAKTTVVITVMNHVDVSALFQEYLR